MNTEERNIANALISGLASLTPPPTPEQVEEKAVKLAAVFGYTGDLQNIITEARISVVTQMGSGVSLVDLEAKHDDQWVEKCTDIIWTYANAYDAFLREEGLQAIVAPLREVTTRILGLLQDPHSEGTSWNRRGLVIGHVQSGKTANYTGLIARAADAGYKFIIVIAGIHNNLRKQTQERIDKAFIGRSSDPDDRRKIGVGLKREYPHPVTLTNIRDDFSRQTAAQAGWQINDFSKPIIVIIKKNVTTLKALYEWLYSMNTRGEGRIADIPMLMIDDEADNASINTNKDDIDPTRTNEKIRQILSLFAKSCYVGYTATPFANIFINPEAYSKEVLEDLFPRDFIYCLDAPNTYFGAEKVFLNDETSETFLRTIEDCEDFLPYNHRRDLQIQDLPPSLLAAFNAFIVARAIRNIRGQANKHCSLMVNVSRFVQIQREVKTLLVNYADQMRHAIQANYRMPESHSSQNIYMKGLHQAFEAEFGSCNVTWVEVKDRLQDVFQHLSFFVINSKSDDVLDYARFAREGVGLTAVAIGGLSLSRGLTIEGLTISYMYRNTRMYDTLMQMGRWFGYRPGYEDICRVYLSPDSIDWYAHIAQASEELRQQIKRMRRDKLSPKQFGLFVRSHPDALLITARNKMRASQEVTLEQNLSGDLKETNIVSTDPDVSGRNFALIERFWKRNFDTGSPEDTKKGLIFRNVAAKTVLEFLSGFECHPLYARQMSIVEKYLELISEHHPHVDVLLISPGGIDPEQPYRLKSQKRAVSKGRLDGTAWRLNKGRVASRGDESLGLSAEQKALAEDEARKENQSPSDWHYRAARNKPLLMIHSLQPKSDEVKGPIPAYGVSFPCGEYSTTVSVVVNKVWLEQMQGYDDNPDDEEDYDA